MQKKEGEEIFTNELITISGVRGFIDENGVAQLNLEDVARGLGFTQTKNGTEYVRWETVYGFLSELGFSQQVGKDDFIPENIFYRLAMKAKNETAEFFQAKVADEILPAIRKTGMYATEELLNNPDLAIKAFTALKEEREKTKCLLLENAQQNQIIHELQPKATYYDLILQNKSLLAISKIAKDYGLSAMALNSKLHELGIQFKQGDVWLLYQKYADKGYTQSKTHVIDDERNKFHTYWTQKGRLFIYDLLKQNGILPLIEQHLGA
jgi:phage antirepressor YoqD-like protein